MRFTFVVPSLLLIGCYRYVPSVGVEPGPGDDVRITLSADATQRLAPVLGVRTTSLSGRILTDAASEFELAVDRTFKDDGVAVVWAGDHVKIPHNAITQTERRVLDRKQTFLATGGIVVSAVVSAFLFSKYRSNGGGSAEGTPTLPPP